MLYILTDFVISLKKGWNIIVAFMNTFQYDRL